MSIRWLKGETGKMKGKLDMDTVKTRKQGNAVTVTFASKFNVPEGKTYYITKEDDGTIVLIPKMEVFFEGVVEGQFVDADENELARDFTPRGQEWNE